MPTYTTLISVAELDAALGQPHVRVVDCRFDLMNSAKGREDYLASHVPGAVYAHLDDDLAAPITDSSGRHPLPDVEEFVEILRQLGISNDSQVVVYDGAGGGIAARLWWMLRWLGHDSVAVLDGGFAAWSAASLAAASGEESPATGNFIARENSGWVLETNELVMALQNGEAPLLVDAREEARFAGQHEPIDTVAGHIPGAINFPFARSLGEDGRWRSADEVRDAWRALLGGEPRAGWAVMCGSGVTACHLALSAARAGLPPPRLYAGSWSEWIRDAARPREP